MTSEIRSLWNRITSAVCCRRFAVGGSAVGGVLLLSGCGGGDQVPVYPVAGKVSFGKVVPAGAQIVLHPEGHKLPGDAIPVGTIAADGSFKVGTYGTDDGAPAGEYKATVQWFKVVSGPGGSGPGPNVLPAKYADPAKSPIRIAVAEGANDLAPIDIAKK
jgi:hypothetical protein